MKTILIAEDEPIIQEMLVRFMTRWGYNAISASDGASAVVLAGKALPDLILMDMGLPILNGWQATHRLRAMTHTKSIPIIAVTAYAMNSDRLKCLSVGCNAFESKPIDFEHLQQTIRKLIEPEQPLAATAVGAVA